MRIINFGSYRLDFVESLSDMSKIVWKSNLEFDIRFKYSTILGETRDKVKYMKYEKVIENLRKIDSNLAIGSNFRKLIAKLIKKVEKEIEKPNKQNRRFYLQ